MKFFSDGEDDSNSFDGIFSNKDSYEERKFKMERAKEIANGTVMGTFERDDEVWNMVKQLKENK